MQKESLAVPISIVIAAGLIAGAIYLNGGKAAPVAKNTDTSAQVETKPDIEPVGENDHILGDPNAPIIIVEYSDYDCPYCDIFHETMKKIVAEYGPSSKVAWVFRHFPIPQLHPNAPKISEAAECVAELGGNDAFWKFSDAVFGAKIVDPEKKIVEFTDMAKIPGFAKAAGVDEKAFNDCLSSGKYTKFVSDSIVAAQKAGGRGTPYPIIIAGDQFAALAGAEPYESVKAQIDALLAQQNAN